MMKKTIYALLILFVFTVVSAYSAGPYLVCTPDSRATSYVITFLSNGNIEEVPAPLHMDMEGVSEGLHDIEVMAKNMWGVSSAVPFSFTKELPGNPTNIGFQEEGH